MNKVEPLRVVILIDSTRHGRLAPVVANWFAGFIEMRKEFVIDVIDLAETVLPDIPSKSPAPTVEALRPRLAAADTFVVIAGVTTVAFRRR